MKHCLSYSFYSTRLKLVIAILLITIIEPASLLSQSPEFTDCYEHNHIIMNGDDWSGLRNNLSDLSKLTDGKFQILQIGDSHIQADFSAAVVRICVQEEFGNGGRGCIAALRIAGTNQPVDYSMTIDVPANRRSRLLSKEWTTEMGVTGVSVAFDESKRKLHISTNSENMSFTTLILLHANGPGYKSALIADSIFIGDQISAYATKFTLPNLVDSVTLETSFDSPFFGAYLLNSQPGVVYNAIGNNGACFLHYNKITNFAEQTKVFSPQLIILSLGTNEAFGNESAESIYNDIDILISNLKAANPKAKFLLTTPMECQKKITRTTYRRVKIKKGKYRRKSRRISTFITNQRIAEVRDVILKYGTDNQIPVWDLYDISGGKGASTKWLNNGLMNPRDHVHCTQKGYMLRGTLLAHALLMELKTND